ncbi:MAG: hypothetical protein QM817_40575 [Archangium sp.]
MTELRVLATVPRRVMSDATALWDANREVSTFLTEALEAKRTTGVAEAVARLTERRAAYKRSMAEAQTSAAQTFAVERALVETSLGVIRVLPPRIARPSGLVANAACPAVNAHHEGLVLYLEGIAASDITRVSKGIFLINQALRCMSVSDALRFNDALARALAGIERAPVSVRRVAGAALLPVIVVVLDATKHLGPTPLLQHVVGSFEHYAAAFSLGRSAVHDFGLWLPASASWDLTQVRSFCETKATSGCISGHGLLRALTDPLAIGLGDCGLLESVNNGLDSLGAYSCRSGVCVAAAVKSGASALDVPFGIREAARVGTTPYGIPIDTPAFTSQCLLDCGGDCPSGASAGANGVTVQDRGLAKYACFVDASATTLSCAMKSVKSATRIGTLTGGNQPSVPTGDQCLRSDASSQPAGQPSSSPTTPAEDEAIERKREAVAKNLEERAKQDAVIAVLKGTGVKDQFVRDVMNEVARDLRAWFISLVFVSDGDPNGMLTPDGKRAAAWTNGVQIVFDLDFVRSADPTGSGSLGAVWMHEVMHIVFARLGLGQSEDGEEGHMWMDRAGVAFPKACPDTPKKCGQKQYCSGETDCASECTPISLRVKAFMACTPQSRTPRVPDPIDPSPLDAPTGKSRFEQCGGTIGTFSGEGACLLLRCPDGRMPTTSNGRCLCGGSEASSKSPWLQGCGVLDCPNGAPVAGPRGCNCQLVGTEQVLPNGVIRRIWMGKTFDVRVR